MRLRFLEMKNIILTFTLLISGTLFAQKTNTPTLEQVYQEIDSLHYSELDFIKMQKYYNENIELNNLISKKANQGDKNATDLLEILKSTYQKANSKFGERDIKLIILSYYKSVETNKKFNSINSRLDAKLDSLKSKKEYLEEEIKKDKRVIDSLKNH